MPPSGFLLINKPVGPTSHDVVDAVRRATGTRTVGHAGTLDPFADGLLIIGVGREATRRLDLFKSLPKTYIATLRFGATSDTDDRTGKSQVASHKLQVTRNEIENTVKQFVGEIEQVPPMYSAKKIQGRKLYELARQGTVIERKPARVTVYAINLLHYQSFQESGSRNQAPENTTTINLPFAIAEITCSAGTYIRALARDIGEKLGTGALLDQLTRTKIGPYALAQAIPLNALNQNNWQSLLLHANPESQPSNPQPHTNKISDPNSKVLLFGTFDRLHPGHIDLFRQAHGLGDKVIAGVGRDQVVQAIKGRLPRQDEQQRLEAVAQCGLVDDAQLLPSNPDERFTWIKKISPDIIALGYDQTTFTEKLGEELRLHGINSRIIRLQPYHPEIFKSSKQG